MRFLITNATDVGGHAVGRANSKTETITISKTVLRYWKKHPVYGWDHVKRFLLHEIAHLQTPNDGHGRKWKQRTIALGAQRYWLGPAMRAKDLKGKPRPWMRGRRKTRPVYGVWMVKINGIETSCGCGPKMMENGKMTIRFPSGTCAWKNQTHFRRSI